MALPNIQMADSANAITPLWSNSRRLKQGPLLSFCVCRISFCRSPKKKRRNGDGKALSSSRESYSFCTLIFFTVLRFQGSDNDDLMYLKNAVEVRKMRSRLRESHILSSGTYPSSRQIILFLLSSWHWRQQLRSGIAVGRTVAPAAGGVTDRDRAICCAAPPFVAGSESKPLPGGRDLR